jgi:hypothetical protein
MESSSSSVVTVVPQNTSSPTSEVIDPQATFAALKPLIIKSGEIVAAYSEAIQSRLEGLYYVVDPDYGTFKEQTTSTITKTSTDITLAFANAQSIESKLLGMDTYLKDVKATIEVGELYKDANETPVYGLEIREQLDDNGEVTHTMARFTSDSLEFFGMGSSDPIAYIRGSKLYIMEAEIETNVTLGKYLLDTSDGLAFKWIGGR